jgi:hypothetical protein
MDYMIFYSPLWRLGVHCNNRLGKRTRRETPWSSTRHGLLDFRSTDMLLGSYFGL